MDDITLLVLANPADRRLAMLEALPEETHIAVGDSVAAFQGMAAEASVIFNWSGTRALLREVLGMAPGARWVHTRSAGLDDLLFPELVAHRAVLTNASGVFSPSLGEWVLGAILYFAKDFRRLVRNQAAGVWEQFDVPFIDGQTVGIVGFGDIGRGVAARVRAMGMRVLALKRHAAPPGHVDSLAERIYAPANRCDMLAQCDYVVVTAPLTPETRGMMGAAEFAAMKREAVLVNVGRGPVVDETALIQALSRGLIKGAALDVFDREPLPAGHAFYRLENVLLSPHSADHTPDWLERAMRQFLEQFERFRKGEPLANVVDKRLGY
jgi:phosphoglycerate dehydrogenase-like enzyme